MAEVRKCVCTSKYQDKAYGAGLRVHNEGKAKDGGKLLRCTVCRQVR